MITEKNKKEIEKISKIRNNARENNCSTYYFDLPLEATIKTSIQLCEAFYNFLEEEIKWHPDSIVKCETIEDELLTHLNWLKKQEEEL